MGGGGVAACMIGAGCGCIAIASCGMNEFSAGSLPNRKGRLKIVTI